LGCSSCARKLLSINTVLQYDNYPRCSGQKLTSSLLAFTPSTRIKQTDICSHICFIFNLKGWQYLYYMWKCIIVEALQLHSNILSYWSCMSTVYFPPRGAALCIPGMHSHLRWNQVLLLAMSHYIGDPYMIPNYRLR
jgi:hypothetical protein